MRPEECRPRGGVRVDDRNGAGEVDAVGNGERVDLQGQRLLREAAPVEGRHHPVTHTETGHPGTDSLDDAGDIGARGEGARRLALVLALDDETRGEHADGRLHAAAVLLKWEERRRGKEGGSKS